jgi:hypothetical protein
MNQMGTSSTELIQDFGDREQIFEILVYYILHVQSKPQKLPTLMKSIPQKIEDKTVSQKGLSFPKGTPKHLPQALFMARFPATIIETKCNGIQDNKDLKTDSTFEAPQVGRKLKGNAYHVSVLPRRRHGWI